jgi:hypothetical protein
MRKRKTILGLSVLTAVGVVAALYGWHSLHRSAIKPANFERLTVDLTRSEVEAILGGPPRKESSGPISVLPPKDAERVSLMQYEREQIQLVMVLEQSHGFWVSDEAVIDVRFDGDRLKRMQMIRVRRTDTLWQRVRSWMGW